MARYPVHMPISKPRTTSPKSPDRGRLRAVPVLAAGLSLGVLACADTSLSVDDYAETPAPASPTEGYNEHRNVYFGDVHIHTRYSFDAYLLGAEVTPDAWCRCGPIRRPGWASFPARRRSTE